MSTNINNSTSPRIVNVPRLQVMTPALPQVTVTPLRANVFEATQSPDVRMEALLDRNMPPANEVEREQLMEDVAYFRDNPDAFAALSNDNKVAFASFMEMGLHTIVNDEALALGLAFTIIDLFDFQDGGGEFLGLAARHEMPHGGTLLDTLAQTIDQLHSALGGSQNQQFFAMLDEVRARAEDGSVEARLLERPQAAGGSLSAMMYQAIVLANRSEEGAGAANAYLSGPSIANEAPVTSTSSEMATANQGAVGFDLTGLSRAQRVLILLMQQIEVDRDEVLGDMEELIGASGEDNFQSQMSLHQARLDRIQAGFDMVKGMLKNENDLITSTAEDFKRNI